MLLTLILLNRPPGDFRSRNVRVCLCVCLSVWAPAQAPQEGYNNRHLIEHSEKELNGLYIQRKMQIDCFGERAELAVHSEKELT